MDAAARAIRFNGFITAGDLEGLAGMMTAEHTFVDTAGTVIAGRAACTEAWRSFFTSFPGYRNILSAVLSDGTGVTMVGYSVCPGVPELEGPALWTVLIREGGISEWRVYEDTQDQRRLLGIDDEWLARASHPA